MITIPLVKGGGGSSGVEKSICICSLCLFVSNANRPHRINTKAATSTNEGKKQMKTFLHFRKLK